MTLFKLIDDVSIEMDGQIDYDETIDFNKMLSSISVKYVELTNDNYLELLINYIKVNIELFDAKIVISFGLTNVLTAEEIESLNSELENLGIDLIDFSYKDNSASKYKLLEIDNDYCII